MLRALLGVSVVVLATATSARAVPQWKLPWTSGESWQCQCSYGCGLHSDANNGYHSVDFDKPGLAEDGPGQAVLAAESGTVTFTGLNGAYGYCVKIDHGGGYLSMYAHLRYNSTASGWVQQGQAIGVMGGTGTNGAKTYNDHIHFMIYYNGQCRSYIPQSKPEPMSGYNDLAASQYYTSDNTGLTFTASNNPSQTPTDPSGILHLIPNQVVSCSFTFHNAGTAIWTNDGNSSNYVELHSVNSSWNQDQASSLAYNWIQGSNVRMATTTGQVAPNGDGLYSFQIRTPSTPGEYTLYVALYHPHSSSYISGTGPKIEIEVVSPASAIPVWPVAGDYDGDGYADVAFIDHRGNGSFRIDYASNGYGAIDAEYPWYGNSAGIWSCQASYDGDSKDDYAQLNRDYQHGTLQINYAANGFGSGFDENRDWYGTSYSIIPCPANYNGDSYGDYAQLDLLGTGVWRINYGPNFADGFQDTFPYYGTSQTIFPCPADFDGDGISDIAYLDRSSTGHLKINYASNGFASGFDVDYPWYGESMLIIPYTADYNGDGTGDYGQFDRSTGYWSINYGPDIANGFELIMPWYGTGEYIFGAPRDYDGDGKDDIATFDQSSQIYAINYASNGFVSGHDLFISYQAALSSYPKLSATVDEQTEEVLPTTFTLSQNYPNPFNSGTVIGYSLTEPSQVKLEIFNILGQKVATLVDESQETGYHSVSWDVQGKPSGIYFYRLTTPTATETKKMAVVR